MKLEYGVHSIKGLAHELCRLARPRISIDNITAVVEEVEEEELRNISRNKYARKAGEVDTAIKERTERINRLMEEL